MALDTYSQNPGMFKEAVGRYESINGQIVYIYYDAMTGQILGSRLPEGYVESPLSDGNTEGSGVVAPPVKAPTHANVEGPKWPYGGGTEVASNAPTDWLGIGPEALSPRPTVAQEVREQAIIPRDGGEPVASAPDPRGSLPARGGANNYGFQQTPRGLGIAQFVPGIIGTGATVARTGFNFNNHLADEAARRELGVGRNSITETLGNLLGIGDTSVVANVTIADQPYTVGFSPVSKRDKYTITPDDAIRLSQEINAPIVEMSRDQVRDYWTSRLDEVDERGYPPAPGGYRGPTTYTDDPFGITSGSSSAGVTSDKTYGDLSNNSHVSAAKNAPSARGPDDGFRGTTPSTTNTPGPDDGFRGSSKSLSSKSGDGGNKSTSQGNSSDFDGPGPW